MAKLTYEKSIALAALLTACSLASVYLLAAPQDQGTRQNDFSHVVQIKKTYVRGGDMITIDEVRGPSKERVVGNTYEVSGRYKLASRETAMLGAFVTISSQDRDIHPESMPDQKIIVTQGQGNFTLRLHIWQAGAPHVSFYPSQGGASFGGVYF
jgi:hypothetical protein